MVFSNAVFLFLFFPVVLLGYYLLKGSAKNYWLLFSSLFFYAWNRPEFLALLFVSITVNYLGALAVEKVWRQTGRHLIMLGTVSLNLLLLFYFKYFNFAIDILEKLLSREFHFAEVLLPIGISFFTFQGLSYVVDVYRNAVPAQKNIFKLGMYISFFPQLVAGPIVRYKDIAEEIDCRSVSADDLVYGIRRFVVGLCKKILIADSLAVVADAIFAVDPTSNTVAIAWLGILSYSLQLFFDFSGYSDMAIGMGRIFGFHFLENFNYPYISKSITEFWRRWHMSLSTFFRDYVYIPLGGNRRHVYLNVAVVFLLTGIWHGANYTFVVWGIWHGFFNIAERLVRKNTKEQRQGIGMKMAAHIYTIMVVMIGWVIFRAPDLQTGVAYVGTLFGIGNAARSYATVAYYLDGWTASVLVSALLLSTPGPKRLLDMVQKKVAEPMFDAVLNAALLGMLLLCMMQVASNTYSAFIYFQF